ncbi:MAG: carbohydrate ABC transporter permease [Halanaerobiales bacterium]|nr:carbohydrate ABC transporter permease [Halanaerobiales bacterium]
MNFRIHRKRVTRSFGGDMVIFVVLLAGAAFSALPLIYIVSNAFKPLNELFLFPPQFFVRNPTLDNFKDLLIIMADSWIPFSRYLFNTIFITIVGTGGHVIFASMAAFVLSKHQFRGRKLFFTLVVFSLMFSQEVVAIPKYLTMTYLGWIDHYAAIILPAWAMSLGLFLMKQFIDAMIPDTLLEAARLDGASELRIFWQIVMPIVKPAWLTLTIYSFQELWRRFGGEFIYSEQLKTLPYAFNQIISGGIAWAGVSSAVALVMMGVPIIIFIINQSKVVETMATSGLD